MQKPNPRPQNPLRKQTILYETSYGTLIIRIRRNIDIYVVEWMHTDTPNDQFSSHNVSSLAAAHRRVADILDREPSPSQGEGAETQK